VVEKVMVGDEGTQEGTQEGEGNNPRSMKDAMLSIEKQRVRGRGGKTKDKSTNNSKTKNSSRALKDTTGQNKRKGRHQLETDTSASAFEGKKGNKVGRWLKKHRTDPRYFTNHK